MGFSKYGKRMGRPCIKSPKRRRPYRVPVDHADEGAKYLPSPEEIAEAAAAIRDSWSDGMKASRCQLPGPEPVETQVIHVARGVKSLVGDHS